MNNKGRLITIVITIIIFAAVLIMVIWGGNDPQIAIQGDAIKIDCIYGTQIPMSEFEAITLDARSFGDIAPSWNKTNGFDGFNGALRGNFKTDELGALLVYVNKNSSPTIILDRADKPDVYISLSDPAETERLYEAISASL